MVPEARCRRSLRRTVPGDSEPSRGRGDKAASFDAVDLSKGNEPATAEEHGGDAALTQHPSDALGMVPPAAGELVRRQERGGISCRTLSIWRVGLARLVELLHAPPNLAMTVAATADAKQCRNSGENGNRSPESRDWRGFPRNRGVQISVTRRISKILAAAGVVPANSCCLLSFRHRSDRFQQWNISLREGAPIARRIGLLAIGLQSSGAAFEQLGGSFQREALPFGVIGGEQ